MIRFGTSGMPPENGDDAAFLDDLVHRGHEAFELAFVKEFPWNERRCRRFGELAAERGIALSVHAPYFAILTIEDHDRSKQCVAAIEHSMKLAAACGGTVVCAHLGNIGDRSAEQLMELTSSRIASIAGKVEDLGIGLGLETAGNDHSFGTIGDIALLSAEFGFVRPVIDWAHVHAMTGGGLTTVEAFETVIGFLRESFPASKIHPLQAQFSDNELGPHGEIRHVEYGKGTLRVAPLVEAADNTGLEMVLISEARDADSHERIHTELVATTERLQRSLPGRPLGNAPGASNVRVEAAGDKWRVVGAARPLLLSNIDKPFFPGEYTKGDLIGHYAEVAPILLPHLAGRPISMSRYPDGIEGASFYEKRAPGHQPDWMDTATVSSASMGGDVEFLLGSCRESLMWFANMGCVELHPFHSRIGSLGAPDYAIFDLDPAEGATWAQVITVAGMVSTVLDQLSLRGYPKLSGARGLHVYVPLDPIHSFERVRRFVGAVGELLAKANPEDVTMDWDIPKRKGRVFVDHNRNASGQTIASVYSVRPRPGAPVSVPVRWEELDHIANGDVTIADLGDRIRRAGDLFAPVIEGGQTLDAAEERLGLSSGR